MLNRDAHVRKVSFEREGLNSQRFNIQQLKQLKAILAQQILVLEALSFFPQKPQQPSKTAKSLPFSYKLTKGSHSQHQNVKSTELTAKPLQSLTNNRSTYVHNFFLLYSF